MRREIKKEESKFIRYFKFTAKWTYKICVGIAVATAYVQPVSATVVTVVAVCSGISSTFRDRTNTRFDKLNKVADGFKIVSNALALNFDKASNDPKINQ